MGSEDLKRPVGEITIKDVWSPEISAYVVVDSLGFITLHTGDEENKTSFTALQLLNIMRGYEISSGEFKAYRTTHREPDRVVFTKRTELAGYLIICVIPRRSLRKAVVKNPQSRTQDVWGREIFLVVEASGGLFLLDQERDSVGKIKTPFTAAQLLKLARGRTVSRGAFDAICGRWHPRGSTIMIEQWSDTRVIKGIHVFRKNLRAAAKRVGAIS